MAPEQDAVEGRLVGTITHFFGRISVGIIDLSDTLRVGETIRIKGPTTDLTQTVESMQIDHADVETAGPGDDVAVLVTENVRVGDKVYRVA